MSRSDDDGCFGATFANGDSVIFSATGYSTVQNFARLNFPHEITLAASSELTAEHQDA